MSMRWLRRMAHWLPAAFLVVTAVGAAAFGITFFAFADNYRRSPSLHKAFELADAIGPGLNSGHVLWSLAMVLPAIAIGVCVVAKQAAALWPCVWLSLVFVTFGLCAIPPVSIGSGVPSAIIAYSLLGCYSGLVGLLAVLNLTPKEPTT